MTRKSSILPKHRLVLAFVFFGVASCCRTVCAQSASDVAANDVGPSNAAVGKEGTARAPANKPEDDFRQDINLFLHGAGGRFWRAFEYDFQRVEQPNAFVTATGTTVPNPEHYLNDHTVKFQFSELFPPSSTLADAVKAACGLRSASGLCPEASDNFRWIASGGAVWKRALAGTTINVDLAERPALQQGVLVTNPSFTNHYQITGGIDFDPKDFFLSGTTWSKAYDTTTPKNNKVPSGVCAKAEDASECIKDLAGPRLFAGKGDSSTVVHGHHIAMAFLAAAVPTFSFKRMSQFDFIKNNGILVPASFLENAQNQFIFKWDLKRAISSSASRTALVPIQNPKQPAGQTQLQQGGGRLCVIVSGNMRSYISVSPSFPAQACAGFAASTGARYLLGCVTDVSISVEADRPSTAPADVDNESCWRDAMGAKVSRAD